MVLQGAWSRAGPGPLPLLSGGRLQAQAISSPLLLIFHPVVGAFDPVTLAMVQFSGLPKDNAAFVQSIPSFQTTVTLQPWFAVMAQ